MKCHKGVAVIITLATLLVTILATVHLNMRTNEGFICLKCRGSIRGYSFARLNSTTEHSPSQRTTFWNRWFGGVSLTEIVKHSKTLQDFNMTSNGSFLATQNDTAILTPGRNNFIRAPIHCMKQNCREFLSESEKIEMKACEKSVRRKEHFRGPFNASDCRFLPQMGRHPVALVSARGSGNTWTRGLLEMATGICTGFIFCDTVMRAHGYIGETVKSGKVLVVKTHSAVPKWRGGSNRNANPADASYSSAVFILRNPVKSAIAEWNRRSAQEILGKHNTAISHERHTYVVSKRLFGGFMFTTYVCSINMNK